MADFTQVKADLKKYLERFNTPEFLVGRLNDEVLQFIIGRIEENPEERFIQLINTLNFFYSTRIQIAKGTRDENVKKISKILSDNWNNGWQLNAIKEGVTIEVKYVQEFREKIDSETGKDFFSLSTKVFHQLNSQYPIYDTRVVNFLNRIGKIKRNELHKSYSSFTTHYFALMDKIGWSRDDVNGFDNAVWIYDAKPVKKSKSKPDEEQKR